MPLLMETAPGGQAEKQMLDSSYKNRNLAGMLTEMVLLYFTYLTNIEDFKELYSFLTRSQVAVHKSHLTTLCYGRYTDSYE